MRKPLEAPEVSLAWSAFFRAIRAAVARLDELEAQECNDGSRQ